MSQARLAVWPRTQPHLEALPPRPRPLRNRRYYDAVEFVSVEGSGGNAVFGLRLEAVLHAGF